jgi:subtilisin family serine protease
VAAPGVSIYSTLPNHSNNTKKLNYGYLSGTSMATPFVSGLAALLLSSGADSNKVTQIIGENSDRISGTGINWVYGRINALRSISSLNQPTPTILIISVTPTVISTNTPAPTVTSTPAPSPVKNPRSKLCNRFAWLCQK